MVLFQGLSSNFSWVVIFWCHFTYENRIRRKNSKKVIFGGLHPVFVNENLAKITNLPILRKFPKFVWVMQSTWNLDRIIILIKETFPENFIKIRLREGTFHNFAPSARPEILSKYEKFSKNAFLRSDFDEIFRKRFFYQYYDPVQISSRLHNSIKFWKFP